MSVVSRVVETCCMQGVHGAASSLGVFILRVGAGGLMVAGHGWGKLKGFSSMASEFPDPLGIGSTLSLGLATFAEFFCAILLILGLGTRVASLALVANMAVAGLIFHAQDPLAKKELALLYLVCFVVLLFTGAGKASVDAILTRGRRKEAPKGP